MNHYDLIVNPYAGRGRCVKEVKKITSYLDAQKIDYSIHTTTCRKHATEIAYNLVKNKAYCIISCGGDGTIHEIINGMISAKIELDNNNEVSSTYLALLPCGTGNDFMASCDMPLDTIKALENILSGTPHKTDAIKISNTYEICFACHGIDVDVVNMVNAGKHKTKLSYLKNILLCIFRGIKYGFDIVIDDNINVKYTGIFAGVFNGKKVAGGLDFCPSANPSDGLFDIILIEKHGAIRTLFHFAKIKGNHFIDGKFVRHYQAKKVQISANQNIIDIDGELFENKKFDAEIASNIIDLLY